MIFPWLTIFDFGTARSNFIKPLDLEKVEKKSTDFAILLPIFNDTKYLTNLDFIKQFGRKVVLCTTNHETEEFRNSLNELRKKYGFRITISNLGGGC